MARSKGELWEGGGPAVGPGSDPESLARFGVGALEGTTRTAQNLKEVREVVGGLVDTYSRE